MPAVYTAKLRGIEVWAANSEGSIYPILKTIVTVSEPPASSMTIHLGLPQPNGGIRNRIVQIKWNCRATQLQGTYYCSFKATNVTVAKPSHSPKEVHWWVGTYTNVRTNRVHSSADPWNRNGWSVLAQSPVGLELATVNFKIRKARNPSMIPTRFLDHEEGCAPSVREMLDSGFEPDLEKPLVTFRFIFESVSKTVYHLLPEGCSTNTAPLAGSSKSLKRKRNSRGESHIVHLGTIDLVDLDADEDKDCKPGASQKRRSTLFEVPSPDFLTSTDLDPDSWSANPLTDIVNLPVSQLGNVGRGTKSLRRVSGEASQQPPRLTRASTSLILLDQEKPDDVTQSPDPSPAVAPPESWGCLGALAEEKSGLLVRVRGLIKKDEARIQALKEFISKYEV